VLVRGPLVDTTAKEPRVRGIIMAGRDGRDIRVPAPMVIAADGRRSRLAAGVGLARHPRHPRRWAIGAYFQDVSGMTSFGEMHVRRGRYVGVAPLPSGETNLCLVIPGPRLRGGGGGFEDPSALLRFAIDREPSLRERFAAARMTAAPVMMGPLAVDAVRCGVPGLLLAGDAAGFIDPMTGDGLRFAVRGGELAAEAALAAFTGAQELPHLRLAAQRRREFAAKWRFNRALRRLVGAPVSVELAGIAAAAAPWILRRTIAFAGDVTQQ
jgi:flavin-dependent dehydrogenase